MTEDLSEANFMVKSKRKDEPAKSYDCWSVMEHTTSIQKLSNICMDTSLYEEIIIKGKRRLLDSFGYVIRAGCLCFSDVDYKSLLLVTSKRGLIVPAGGLERSESVKSASLRETEEEAGVFGEIITYIGCFENIKKKSKTHMYSIVVNKVMRSNQWLESDRRDRLYVDTKDIEHREDVHPCTKFYVRVFLKSLSVNKNEASEITCPVV